MRPTDHLSQFSFLFGLALLLVVSVGIWYNLKGLARRFPQLIRPPQQWFAAFAIVLLTVSIPILGLAVASHEYALSDGALGALGWSSLVVAGTNGFWYGISLRSMLGHSENTREQLIQKQLLMQSVSQAQQNLLLKEQVRETKRRHLKSQMNPHFIFNVLTGIQNLLQEGNSQKAGTVFSRFRRLLMLGFMSQDRVLGSLAQEMDHVEQYLELEQTRLSASIQFQWKLAPDVVPSVIPCPLFILQPLVENAIWHGLSGTGIEQPTLEINIHWKDQDLVIAVCDNGRGMRTSEEKSREHKSRGTAIVKERLALLRHRGQLEILDCPANHPFERGVMARMTLPLWALEPSWHTNEERKAS